MTQYFLIAPETNGAFIYIATEEGKEQIEVNRITHCFYDDFSTLMSILIKEKEIYKIKVFKHMFNDIAISELNKIENIEIEVIESV